MPVPMDLMGTLDIQKQNDFQKTSHLSIQDPTHDFSLE